MHLSQIQYHNKKGRGEYLPAAEYNFVTQVDGRGVYSFCMCPGGFVIPAATELDLKKAAKTVGEKSIDMLKSRDLLPLTGYVHGGCSPIGMKKFFRTTFHKSAADCDTICVSAGRRGYQVELPLNDFAKVIRFETADVIVD